MTALEKITIIIACYNELPHLKASIAEIDHVLAKTRYCYDLIFIDDCSIDGTQEIIKDICREKPNFKYILHEKNVGRGGTVKEGLLMSNTKIAGYLDIDLEVHARYIPALLEAIEKGSDAAIAHRYYDLTQTKGIIRAILSLVYRLIVKYYLSLNIQDTESGFKFFNMEKCRNAIIKTQNNKWFWDTEIIYYLSSEGRKISEIPCLFIRNKDKKSTVKLIPDVISYLKAIIKFKKNIRT